MTSKFIKCLSELSETEDLNVEKANKIILSMYPDDYSSNSKSIIRAFVPDQLNKVPEEDILQALQCLQLIYQKIYPNTSTRDTLLSKDIRNVIANRFGRYGELHTLSKKIVKLNDSEKKELVESTTDKLYLKIDNRIKFTADQVLDVIRKGINSKNIFVRGIALLFACGSRPIELFDKSDYSECDISDKITTGTITTTTYITQGNLAKKKQENNEETVLKPLICINFEQFTEALDYVRSLLKQKYGTLTGQDGQLKTAISSNFNRNFKKLFKGDGSVTLYSARPMYAHLSYHLYSREGVHGSNPGLGSWINKTLGHLRSQLGLLTSFNYNQYELVDSNGESLSTNRAEVTILKSKIDDMTEEIKDMKLLVDPKKLLIDNTDKICHSEFCKLAESGKVKQADLINSLKGKVSRSKVFVWWRINLKSA